MTARANRMTGKILFSDKEAADHWGAPASGVRALARFRRIDHVNLFGSPRASVKFTKQQLDRIGADAVRQMCAALEMFGQPADCIDHLRRKCRGPQKGFVYFVTDGGAIKIGFAATNVAARLRELQCANPRDLTILGSTSGSVELERLVHGRFRHIRIRGEWFRNTKTLRRFIEAVKAYDIALGATLSG